MKHLPRSTSRPRWVAASLVMVGTLVAPTGAAVSAAQPRTSATAVQAAVPLMAVAAVKALPVKGRAPMTGYDRAKYGQSWADTDRNGCDTRNDVLRRDLRAYVLKAGTRGCLVLRGTLRDPYTLKTIGFVRGPASARVQVDHVVALGDSWAKGAQQWPAAKRAAFANDGLNLLAVDGPSNQRKGAGDAATWLPPNKAYRCQYVARQATVKRKYGLSVTKAERGAMLGVLTGCLNQRLVVATAFRLGGGTTPKPVVKATPKPAPRPQPQPAVYYANCDAVRAAGAAPIHRGDPGWEPKFDRDGDGVGCE